MDSEAVVSRRRFIGALAALGAGSALGKTPARPRGRSRPYRIDVHHHFVPPGLQKEGLEPLPWSPARALEDMTEAGIGTAITSLAPGAWAPEEGGARRLARETNDYAAQLRIAHVGRFGMFATLPMPDLEGSLLELDYVLGALRAEGIALSTGYAGKPLGDPQFTPLLEELNKRAALVCVQPDARAGDEPATDAARCMESLLFTGAAARYADIRWLFLHAGAIVPSAYVLFQRREADMGEKAREALPNGLKAEMQKFRFDTFGASEPPALDALTALMPTSQLLYGSHYPLGSPAEVTERLREHKWKRNELRMVERENALRLMPRLALVA